MAVDSTAPSFFSQISGAIKQAAKSSGISFEYLLTTAKIESNLNPAAQAATSSAKGLYQFIEQTWLGTLKSAGNAVGLGRYADAITQNADGRYEVSDPSMRNDIMKLRSDPTASAMMAGAFTRANSDQLENAIGRKPTEGELYIAHFLGPDGASKLIGAAATQPNASAASMFPAAASANTAIFYDKTGQARSAADVYAKLSGKFEVARSANFAPSTQTAAASPAAPVPPTVPDTAGVTAAFAAANNAPPLPDTKPLFQAMFTDRARQAVSSTVNSLWGAAAKNEDASAAKARANVQAQSQTQGGHDLFTDTPTDIRGLFRGGV